jgi:hypothetical protein
VVAGYGDISHPDLAVMAAAQFDTLGGDVLDDHHVVGFFGDSLEDDVVALRLVDGEELVLDVALLDVAGVLVLADLAVELLEVVLDGAAHHFLLHLRLVPLLQAAEVDQSAGAGALAGTAEEAIGLLGLAHVAVLALLLGEVDVGVLTDDDLLGDGPELGLVLSVFAGIGGGDEILDASEFDDLPVLYVVSEVLSLYPLFSLFLFLRERTMR